MLADHFLLIFSWFIIQDLSSAALITYLSLISLPLSELQAVYLRQLALSAFMIFIYFSIFLFILRSRHLGLWLGTLSFQRRTWGFEVVVIACLNKWLYISNKYWILKCINGIKITLIIFMIENRKYLICRIFNNKKR